MFLILRHCTRSLNIVPMTLDRIILRYVCDIRKYYMIMECVLNNFVA